MQPNQIQLVQDTFNDVKAIGVPAMRLFYERLFTLDPSLRAMFASDMDKQYTRLMQALEFAVTNLHQPARALPALKQLGKRHVEYGVRDEHYDVVAQALLGTLAVAFGERFTPTARKAWSDAYELLAGAMKEGAAEVMSAAA